MMRPGHAWLLTAAVIAGCDWWLIRHGQPTMSALARTHRRATAISAALLTAHLLGSSRYDPLTATSRRLTH